MDANGLEQNVVLSQLKQCRSHMLTQRKRRQKNRLICIQLRLLRTRFEIKDTWIENDFDLFFLGGGGVKRWDGKLCVPTEKSWLRPCRWRAISLPLVWPGTTWIAEKFLMAGCDCWQKENWRLSTRLGCSYGAVRSKAANCSLPETAHCGVQKWPLCGGLKSRRWTREWWQWLLHNGFV